jgi:phage terminase large subunit-like protein
MSGVITLDDIESWKPDDRAQIIDVLQRRIESPPQAWYCKRGRTCDGHAHEGYPYPHARADQWPPEGPDWFVWAILSGRGAGKTRTGGEWCRKMSNHAPRIAGIGRRGTDIRSTMVEGDSGLIRVCEIAGQTYQWEPSKREFTFQNGGKVYFYTAEEPDSLRGPQHHLAWLDEPAHMPLIEDVWDNLLLGLRLGRQPRVLVTSTPTPIKWVKELVKKDDTRVVRVSTYANIDNLAPTFRKNVIERYEGTRLGRQELHGEIIEDVEGALWSADLVLAANDVSLDDFEGVPYNSYLGNGFERIVVSVDPAGTSTKRSDDTGIVVVARLGKQFFVLEDATGKYSPDGWAKKVVSLFKKWSADRVVAEKNYGGEMVRSNMKNQDENLPITLVTSRRGKEIRAEPIVGLYEQGRVKHIGDLTKLEGEQLEWVPGEGDSPNRIDALVHGITNLMKAGGKGEVASGRGRRLPTSPLGPGYSPNPLLGPNPRARRTGIHSP